MPKLSISILAIPLVITAQSTPDGSSNDPSRAESNAPTGGTPIVNPSQQTESLDDQDFPGATSVPATPSFYGASAPDATSSIGIPKFAGTPTPRAPGEEFTPLQWGPFSAHPHLSYGFTYATGVLALPGRPTDTASHNLSPGLSVASRHLSIDYTPSLSYYTKGPYEDTVNHSAHFLASFGYNDWSFNIGQSFEKSSQPLIETGSQTETQSLVTSLGANWLFNEKIFFDFSITQQFQDSQGYQSSKQWSTMDWINYRITQHLSVGAGIGGGYSEVEFGSDSTFEQIQGRLNWNPSRRLSFHVNGGIEIRQFIDSNDSDNLINPLMGVGASYQLFDSTSIFLNANRSVNSSLFANDINETTTVTGGVNQRLFKRFFLGVVSGYRTTDYKAIGALSANRDFLKIGRSDSLTFVSTSIGTSFLKKGNISFSYQHSINESSLGGYSYDSDQFTAQVRYRF